MTNRRFINSVIATALTCDVQMPWTRRSPRVLRKLPAKTPAQTGVTLSDYHTTAQRRAA